MKASVFTRRPIEEVSLRDLLMWADKVRNGEWSPYSLSEIIKEQDRRYSFKRKSPL